MSTISSFKYRENNCDDYRCNDCMVKFCEFIREHLDYEIEMKMKLLTNEQQKTYKNANIKSICKENN